MEHPSNPSLVRVLRLGGAKRSSSWQPPSTVVVDSKDQELLALIERRKYEQKRPGPSERHQQGDQTGKSGTTKDPKDMRKYRRFLKKPKE